MSEVNKKKVKKGQVVRLDKMLIVDSWSDSSYMYVVLYLDIMYTFQLTPAPGIILIIIRALVFMEVLQGVP